MNAKISGKKPYCQKGRAKICLTNKKKLPLHSKNPKTKKPNGKENKKNKEYTHSP